jgi:hypothetical protein
MPPTADPNLPTYLYEMDPSGGDLHAITSGESEDNDPDTRVNPTDSTDLIYAHAPSPYVTPAFQERYAPAGGDFGSAGTLGISGFSPRLSPASSSEIAYIGPSANDVLLKPSNFRVTWDSGLKNHISWAAATEPLTARGAPYGFVHLPTAGDRVVPGWVDCLHRTGCIDALRLLVGPRHLLAVRRFSLKYQTGREVSFQLNNKQRKLEALGTRLRLQLVEKAGGQVKHQSMQSVRLRFASSLSATGPANAQANKRLLLHGRLSLQSAGVSANASSNANRSVSIVATSSLGELRSLKAKTGKNGGYSVRFAPDTPGIWRIVAMWPGASTHAGDTSAVLHVHIKPPARLATRLTIGCPGKLAQKSPLHVSGDISPALYHAAITITYTPPGETAVRHSVTTNIVGHYSDSIIESHAGTWTTQASFAGGGSYGPSRSAVCHTTVIRPA